VRGLAVACALLLGGCLMPRYLSQAASGQLSLLHDARPIDDVIQDPDVPLSTRELLAEIPAIKVFAKKQGLKVTRNYRKFVQLDRDYAVYFVGAADPLSFTPRMWCFPIAGCFAGLGWFDEDEAVKFRDELIAQGYDAMARPASAYSTGGWFPDPLLSSMLPDGDPATLDEQTGFADLANVFLHESMHATVFVPDQPYFNEGIAEYVGDQLAEALLIERFGETSLELLTYRDGQRWLEARTLRQLETYDDLKAVYDSDRSDKEKLAKKKTIIDSLVKDLQLRRRPNNASLVEVRVYLANYKAFGETHRECGSVAAMIGAAKTVRRRDFDKDLQEEFPKVLEKIKLQCRSSSEKVAPASTL
jgi:predicted aminopeptidase